MSAPSASEASERRECLDHKKASERPADRQRLDRSRKKVRSRWLAMLAPLAPVRRTDLDRPLRTRLHPPAEDAPARKNERVSAIVAEDG
jgi:hypothetical protein